MNEDHGVILATSPATALGTDSIHAHLHTSASNHHHQIGDHPDFHSSNTIDTSLPVHGQVSLNHHLLYQEVPSTSSSMTSMQPSTSAAPAPPNGSGDAGGSGAAPAYDDMFPALPDGPQPGGGNGNVDGISRPPGYSAMSSSGGAIGSNRNSNQLSASSAAQRGPSPGMSSAAGTNKMKVRSTNVTQVFKVAPENRRHLSEIKNKVDIGGSGNGGGPDQAKICRDIMAKTGTMIELCNSKDGTLTFLITGKEDAVMSAKRLIGAELQTQTSTTVRIPKAHHRFLLGKSGKKLQDLQEATGTKISVPRQDTTGPESELIKIVGTKEGIDKAVHEMMLVSHEIASKSNERLAIEREYHPFINGPFGETLKAIQEETGAKVNIPPPSVNKNEISISGETNAVALAKDIILRLVADKRKRCKTVQVEVRKQQHRYVIGPKGVTIQEILKKHGVSIEMPPTDNPSETITLRGEQEKLGPALTLLYEKAHSEIDDEIDAPAWMQKYIIGPKGSHFQEISADFAPGVVVNFIAAENKIKLHGPTKDVDKAREVLENEVKRVKREVSIGEMKVDPKYHRFLIGKSGATINLIRQKTGATVTIPTATDDSHSTGTDIIRIEGNPRQVELAKAELEVIIQKRKETDALVTKEVPIEQRFHRQIIGTKGETIREIRDRFNQVVITFPESNVKSDKVMVRGPKEDVDNCCKYLAQFNKDLLAINYRFEVPIFKQFHKFLIGKDGANIKKIREETHTKIELPQEGSDSDVIVISGKRADVEKAVEAVKAFQDELINVVQVDIIIPAKIHNSIIGTKGRQIRAIMEECGGVLIKFPSENSGSDKVSIRGPKDCVAKAKQVLVELSNEKQVNSFSVELKAKPEHHRFLIGKNGANIKRVRDSTHARIYFPSEKDPDSDTIVIMGKKEEVSKAKAELETMIRDLEKIVEDSVSVDPKYQKHFVGGRGRVVQSISAEFGGVQISFPRPNAKEAADKVTLKGSKECVERAKQRILEEVKRLESQVTIEVSIDPVHHRHLMGPRGSNVQAIQTKFNVGIKFPDRRQANGKVPNEETNGGGDHQSDDASSTVSEGTQRLSVGSSLPKDVIKITGTPEECEQAKQALLESVPIEVQVEVPFDYHRFIIGQKGREVRDLMERFDVSISVPHSSEKCDTVKVVGIKDNVMRAKEELESRVRKLDSEKSDREAKSFKVELHVEPSHHPKIIGKRGAVITKIRANHNVQIQFPERDRVPSSQPPTAPSDGTASPVTGSTSSLDPDLIVISGYQANAEAARDEILALVKSLESQTVRELKVDARIHPRLIGSKGKNIGAIMKKFGVDIKFPRSGDSNPNLVTISGEEEDVDAAADHILNLEEEYLDDVAVEYTAPSRGNDANKKSASDKKGFSVAGAPWQMPDTNDTEQFPSMGLGGTNESGADGNGSAGPWNARSGRN